MLELLSILMFFTIIAAIVAIETKDLLGMVVSITAVGFGLIIAFFFMLAQDFCWKQRLRRVGGDDGPAASGFRHIDEGI
jgi:hypothetical protein